MFSKLLNYIREECPLSGEQLEKLSLLENKICYHEKFPHAEMVKPVFKIYCPDCDGRHLIYIDQLPEHCKCGYIWKFEK